MRAARPNASAGSIAGKKNHWPNPTAYPRVTLRSSRSTSRGSSSHATAAKYRPASRLLPNSDSPSSYRSQIILRRAIRAGFLVLGMVIG
jgi:hypothetical protein